MSHPVAVDPYGIHIPCYSGFQESDLKFHEDSKRYQSKPGLVISLAMQKHAPTHTNRSPVLPLKCAEVGDWCVELLPRRAYSTVYTPDTAVIGFALESQTGVHAFASDRRTDFWARPNSLAYLPAGCDVMSESQQGGEYLTIKVAHEPADESSLQFRFNDVMELAAINAAHRLRNMLLTSEPTDSLAFERCARALVDCVSSVLNGPGNEPRAKAWMTTRRLKTVNDVIEAKLDEKLTVGELAAELGLSAGFFSRALKAAVGRAPHNYIIDRRISRARALLCSAELELSAVALASGFASHAHMTSVFRSRLGVTPRGLRKDFF